MDLLLACEDLIPNVVDNIDDTEAASDQDIKRWQQLFGFATRDEASNAILEWRGDLGRNTLSPESWAIIKDDFKPSGYDKEAYEFYLASQKPHRRVTQPVPKPDDTSSNSSYLLKLEGPIPDAQTVQAMAGLSYTPKVVHGSQAENDDHSPDSNKISNTPPPSPLKKVTFCLIDGHTKAKLLPAFYLHQTNPHSQASVQHSSKPPEWPERSSRTIPYIPPSASTPPSLSSDHNHRPSHHILIDPISPSLPKMNTQSGTSSTAPWQIQMS